MSKSCPIQLSTKDQHLICQEYSDGKNIQDIQESWKIGSVRFHQILKAQIGDVGFVHLKYSNGQRVPIQVQNEICEQYCQGKLGSELVREFDLAKRGLKRFLRFRGVSAHSRSHISSITTRKTAKGVNIPHVLYTLWKQGSSVRARSIRFEVSIEDLEKQFTQQEGRCYYTGIPMRSLRNVSSQKHLRKDPYAISLDRLDSSRDYTTDNIVLCCRFANFMKSRWSEDQVREVLSEIRHPTRAMRVIDSERPSKDTPLKGRPRTGTEHIAGYFWCRWRAGAIAHKRSFELTNQDLEDLYVQQGGLCYYTGTPMVTTSLTPKVKTLAYSPYLISLDRLDSSRGYVKGNIALCCIAINYAKNRWDEATFKSVLTAIKSHTP